MRPLSTAMPAATKKALGKKGMLFGKMVLNWAQIAGEDLAQKAVPVNLKFSKSPSKDLRKKAVLYLSTTPAEAVALNYQKQLLIERLNTFFGYQAVTEIKFIHGQKQASPTSAPLSASLLPSKTPPEVEKLTDGIQNTELKAALESLGTALLRRKSTSS